MNSVIFNPTAGHCLSFWYNMYGSSVSELDVLIKQPTNSNGVVKWKISGNQAKGWKKGRLPIVSAVDYQV